MGVEVSCFLSSVANHFLFSLAVRSPKRVEDRDRRHGRKPRLYFSHEAFGHNLSVAGCRIETNVARTKSAKRNKIALTGLRK